ncbi:MAG: hypothetical protein IPN15_14255 [Saprospiraceae bacterium]|nr:hypothetical protein [Candidatus Vicinibacter affinis]
MPQNQYLVKEYMDQKELKILTWFSEQYYNLMDLGMAKCNTMICDTAL